MPLLFTVVTSSGGALAVFDPATGRSRTIAKTGLSNRYVSGGYLTYARDGTLFAAPFDVQRLTIAGPEVPVVQDVLMRQARTGASGTAGASNASGRIFLVALGANGSADDEPRPLHDASASERDGEISPDGQWAAYVSSETGDDNVYVQPFPGPGPRIRVTADRGSAPRWAPGGRELYYMGGSGAASNALMSVAIPPGASLRPGVPTLLFQKRVGTTWDVTPDRNRFLVELAGDDTTTAMFVTVANWTEELRRGIAAAQ